MLVYPSHKIFKFYKVSGFDLSLSRINKLKKKLTKISSLKKNILKKNITYSNKQKILRYRHFYCNCTNPSKKNNKPDLYPIIQATKIIRKYLKK